LFIDENVSFLGDVNPENGLLFEKYYLGNKILILRSTKGSTVGSYILYSLKKKNHAPLGIVSTIPDPVLITGCVIANIPLLIISPNSLNEIKLFISKSSRDVMGELDTIRGMLVLMTI